MALRPRGLRSPSAAEQDGYAGNFLDDDCGRNALQLAARGSAIIATLQRLSARIPAEFTSPADSPYAKLIFDFCYFKNQNSIEKTIAETAELLALDKEVYDTHIDFLESFMTLFRSIYGYVTELNRFVVEIQDGQYVAQTLDTILDSLEGRQLLCELYQLYGVMLLLMDHKIGGVVRERIIVSYIRYRGSGEAHTVDVAELCRSTDDEKSRGGGGTGHASPTSAASSASSVTDRSFPVPGGLSTYPLRYFERVPIQKGVVGRLLACLRSDDIYRMASHYPNPEHRSAAMALQGSLVYVLLFFCGDILLQQLPVMKELVEKHFADNWVVHYYAGFTADLSVAWAAFPAARDALRRTLEQHNVVYHLQLMRNMLSRSIERVNAVLQEGVLTESYVLDNVHATLLPIITEANVVLRWFVLHGACASALTASSNSKSGSSSAGPTASPSVSSSLPSVRAEMHATSMLMAAAVTAEHSISEAFANDEILTLLLSTAQLEYHVQSRFAVLLEEKSTRWSQAKRQAVSKMKKLSLFFSPDNLLDATVQDDELQRWFREVATRIASAHMRQHNSNATRRKLQRLITALENIQEFDQVNQQLQVLQYVRETCSDLHQMLRYLNAERRVVGRLATVADLSYAWQSFCARNYLVRELQARIQSQPVVAAQMRALFVKVSSLLQLPCIRIDQGIALGCSSVDMRLERVLDYTSRFYSEVVVTFLRGVLQVIPTSVFEVLHKVMYLLTNTLQECPSKLQREDWRKWSQLETREQLAAYTADIARYAAGLLAMEETTIGVVRVNPHQLLEDGIRKELVEHIARELHAGIWFDRTKPSTVEQLDKELAHLGARLRGVRDSFEYIQDFVNVHGLQIWLEEFQRIVRFTLQMECNVFWPKKVYPWNSSYQSTSITIPYFTPAQPNNSYSFLGHLVQHLLHLTDPTEALYFPAYGAWFTRKRLCECVGPRLFTRVAEAIDCVGLTCLDEFFSLLTAKYTQTAVMRLAESVVQGGAPCRGLLQETWTRCMPVSNTPHTEAFMQGYDQLAAHFTSCAATKEASTLLMRIGRIVLMRQLIAHQLRLDSTQDSSSFVTCLHAVNTSLLATLTAHLSGAFGTGLGTCNTQPCTDVPAGLLCDTALFLEAVGLTNPLAAVYEVAEGSGGGGGTCATYSAPSAQLKSASSCATSAAAAATAVTVPATLALPLFVLPLCLVLLLNVEHTIYSAQFDSCIPAEKKDDVDATVLAVGVASLLQQFPLEATQLVVQLLAQVVRVATNAAAAGRAHAKERTPLVLRCAKSLPMWMDVLHGYLYRYNEKEWTHVIAPGALDAYMQDSQVATVQGIRA
jgi:WASH complex subunit strumpellin